jgi:hypothetical protein
VRMRGCRRCGTGTGSGAGGAGGRGAAVVLLGGGAAAVVTAALSPKRAMDLLKLTTSILLVCIGIYMRCKAGAGIASKEHQGVVREAV